MSAWGHRAALGAALAIAVCGLAGAAGAAQAAPVGKASSGPFGITIGEPIADLGAVKSEGNGGYLVLNPPSPNAKFAFIFVKAYPSTGVCMITGIGREISDDQRGVQLKAEMDDLSAALETKYGQYKKVDTCDALAEECSQFWTLKLNEGAAALEYDWLLDAATRPDHIGKVLLQAQARDSLSPHFMLTYGDGPNAAACLEADKAGEAGGL